VFYVYILHSKKDSKRYIGMTSDIERRIFEHNSGLVKSTKNRRPFELIHYETFETKSDALSFEKKLKQRKGKINVQLLKEDISYKLPLLNQS
jgi:putative endonuclease